jgi:hypothetical protein
MRFIMALAINSSGILEKVQNCVFVQARRSPVGGVVIGARHDQ